VEHKISAAKAALILCSTAKLPIKKFFKIPRASPTQTQCRSGCARSTLPSFSILGNSFFRVDVSSSVLKPLKIVWSINRIQKACQEFLKIPGLHRLHPAIHELKGVAEPTATPFFLSDERCFCAGHGREGPRVF